jgi:hypothetical protein
MKRTTDTTGTTAITRRLLAALGMAAGLWACASGGGISGTSLVFGPIAGFGSIIVSGIEFDTDRAQVTIEGNSADIADLRLGMVVLVNGSVDEATMSGVAARVAADHLLQGPVEAVNALDGTFVALSQLVVTDLATVFDQTTINTLAAGDLVEVFGFRDADASIRATRVERLSSIDEIELTGAVSNLDEAAMTFEIGLLRVDYGGALLENLPAGGLADGLLVDVETDAVPVADLMIATGIEAVDTGLTADPGDSVDIEGFVTEISTADEFVVNGTQRVITTTATSFEGGTPSDLVANARVDVSGSLDALGNLLAEEVEFVTPILAP